MYRRPKRSESVPHIKGKMAIENMKMAMVRFTVVIVVLRDVAIEGRDGY